MTVHDAQRIEAAKVVTFGSPCQDLSVAGKRAGLSGERSGLFHEAIRIIRDVRPDFAVWENVPGTFSSNGGRDFGTVLDSLAELGAMDIAWRVLDAQYMGVPQRRRRIFVVADFGGERAGEILSLAEGVPGNPAPRRETREGVAGTLGCGSGKRGWCDDLDRATFVPEVAECLQERDAKGTDSNAKALIPIWRAGDQSNCETFVDMAGTLTCADGQRGGIMVHALTANGFDASEDGTGRGTPLVPVSFAEGQRNELRLTGGDGSRTGAIATPSGRPGQGVPTIASAAAVRRLTPTECERLQGFPDGWTNIPGAADGPRYRALGNSVAVPVVEAIAHRIAQHLPPEKRTLLDLFSGIGGFSLAFHRAGFTTVAFAEIEKFPCRVLAHHWPNVPNLGDVTKIDLRKLTDLRGLRSSYGEEASTADLERR